MIEKRVPKTIYQTYFRLLKKGDKLLKSGRPSTKHDEKFSYNKKGQLIRKEWFNPDGGLRSTQTYQYNKQDQLTEEIELDGQGFRNFKYTFQYNEQGRLQKKSVIDADNFTSSYWIYLYDPKDRLIEEKRFGLNDRLVDRKAYSYDLHNQLKELVSYNFEGQIDHKWIYHYDDKGNKIGEQELNGKGGSVFKKEYRYNDLNLEIKRLLYRADGHLNTIQTYEYDKRGNKTSIIHQDSEGQFIAETQYHYTYDADGNWVTKTEFKNENPILLTEREFHFY